MLDRKVSKLNVLVDIWPGVLCPEIYLYQAYFKAGKQSRKAKFYRKSAPFLTSLRISSIFDSLLLDLYVHFR